MSRRILGHRLAWIDAALLSPCRRVIDGGGSIVVARGPVSGALLEPPFGNPLAVSPFLWDVAGSVGVALLFGFLYDDFVFLRYVADRFVGGDYLGAQDGVGRVVVLGLDNIALRFEVFHAFGFRCAHHGSKMRQRSECRAEVALCSALIDGLGCPRSTARRDRREATRGVGATR